MAHNEWCGKPCCECEKPCVLDESIPCSPDCPNLMQDGGKKRYQCLLVGCDALTGEEKSLNTSELYDYIIENYKLDGTACRLVRNIIDYIVGQEFVDAEDAQAHIFSLVDGAFGITKREIELYRAEEKDDDEDADDEESTHAELDCVSDETDGFPCCLYSTPRTLDWCEKNCRRYYSCDTVAMAIDELK